MVLLRDTSSTRWPKIKVAKYILKLGDLSGRSERQRNKNARADAVSGLSCISGQVKNCDLSDGGGVGLELF